MPPELVAVSVTLAPSHKGVEGDAERVTDGAGFTFTECMAVEGAPQPVAVAVIWLVPVQPDAKTTRPVLELIVFPPARLAASRL